VERKIREKVLSKEDEKSCSMRRDTCSSLLMALVKRIDVATVSVEMDLVSNLDVDLFS
jgi:hypothetical protein